MDFGFSSRCPPVINQRTGGKPYLNGCPWTVCTWALPRTTVSTVYIDVTPPCNENTTLGDLPIVALVNNAVNEWVVKRCTRNALNPRILRSRAPSFHVIYLYLRHFPRWEQLNRYNCKAQGQGGREAINTWINVLDNNMEPSQKYHSLLVEGDIMRAESNAYQYYNANPLRFNHTIAVY